MISRRRLRPRIGSGTGTRTRVGRSKSWRHVSKLLAASANELPTSDACSAAEAGVATDHVRPTSMARGEACRCMNAANLSPGDRIAGPAIVTEDISTTVIDAGWEAEVLSQGELLLTDGRLGCDREISRPNPQSEIRNPKFADPVFLEIFNNQLASIAEQMGVTLRNTASSVNVKERLDFSCAIFTADGRLVANAPHVPVHLGAMEETVRCDDRGESRFAAGRCDRHE